MRYGTVMLKDVYPQLGIKNCQAELRYYLPHNMSTMGWEKKKRPCMIVCPGGGYAQCCEWEAEVIGVHFLPEGYNVFVLNYSVAPQRFPQQIREVAAVMELIYKNAEEWNCDTDRIAIIGFSAGGHLAAHYSTMYDCKEVREAFPESKPVNASILCYPVITANPSFSHHGSIMNLCGYYPEKQEELDYFSCECNVTENTPPAFIWHTAEDQTVPVENSFAYAKALVSHKVPVELHVYPFGYHGLATVDEQTNGELGPKEAHAGAWLADVKRWLKLMNSIR